MNEITKTFTFLAVGAAALVAGWIISTPKPHVDVDFQQVGTPFFPDFNDPLKVAAAEVVDFDAATLTKLDVKASRVDDVWQLNPEKQGYPEVSVERLAEVVHAVSDLKKLSVVTRDRTQHGKFGVVDPGSEAELKEGTEGVGKRVMLLDDRKKPLVDLIVGKVDDKNPKLHYVRRPDQDPIYRTEIETGPLSSRFDDWVKPDLLSVGTAELRSVRVNDQSIDVRNMQQGAGGGIVMVRKVPVRIEKARAELAKDDENKWQPKRLETYDKEKKSFIAAPIAAGEEIDTTKLADLGRALKDVKIVDVMKKPKLLAADLKSPVSFLGNAKAAVLQDVDSAEAMQLAGFFPNPSPLGGLELICHEGDMTVGFADGVQYMLRFGDITGKGRAADGEKKEDAKPGDAKPEETAAEGAAKGANTAPNRYLFVTASFNPDLIPKPKLTELPPETPAATPTTPAKTEEPKKADEPKATESKTDAPKADKKKADEKKDEPEAASKADLEGNSCDQEPEKKDEPKPTATPSATASATAKPTASPSATKPAEAAKATPSATASGTKPADAKPADATPSAAKPADAKPADATPSDAAKSETAQPAKPPMSPEERKRIETENKEKQAKYEADLKAGEEKAKKLNAQFADWFYVVSDATFQGLNVDPTTLVKKSTPAASAPPAGPPPGFPGVGLPPGLVPPQ